MASSPTWDAIEALLEELAKIRGPGSGFSTDFGGRVHTKEFDPTAGGEFAGGVIVVRFTAEDGQDFDHEEHTHAYSTLSLAIDAWIPETSSDPTVASALETACRAGDDIVKAVNIGWNSRAEVKSASAGRVVRGTGIPVFPWAKVIVPARAEVFVDYAAIGT
jgi:hypothetical protein